MIDSPTPLAGQLLLALPLLSDARFSRSVTLICQHDDDGAMGVMVNRPSEYTLGDVLGQMGVDGGSDTLHAQLVLAGGPVHPERGFVLHDGGLQWESTMAIGDALYLTTSRDILEAMVQGQGPANAIVALGCAGWTSGQLEAELTDNDWLTVPSDPELLFEIPLDARWETSAGRIGVDFARLAVYAGHA